MKAIYLSLLFAISAIIVIAEQKSPAEKIKESISNNKIQIFSKSNCSYCKNVKGIFDQLELEYHADELDQMEDGSQIQQELENLTGQRTVPNVFIGGKHVGGYDDTAKARASGALRQKLLDAGLKFQDEL